MKKNRRRSPVRVVVMLKGSDVVGVMTDGMPVDCLTLQLDSGETDAVGRPVIGMQRGTADRYAKGVDQMFEMSDRTPFLPHDVEDAKRDYEQYRDAFLYGRNRNN